MQLRRRVVNWEVDQNFWGFVRALGEVAGPSSIICSQTKKSPEEEEERADHRNSQHVIRDLVSGHSTALVDGPTEMPIIKLPSSQAVCCPPPSPSYHFLALERKRKAMPSCQRQVL